MTATRQGELDMTGAHWNALNNYLNVAKADLAGLGDDPTVGNLKSNLQVAINAVTPLVEIFAVAKATGADYVAKTN